jgi:hypothetical protein
MHNGLYRLGDEFRLDFLCYTAGRRVAEPDVAPSIDIYGPSGKTVSGALVAPLDREAATGLFSYVVFLGAQFSQGGHRAVFRYTVSGVKKVQAATFWVSGSGDGSGLVISLYNYRPAHAGFLIQQRTSGGIYKGQNPREDV